MVSSLTDPFAGDDTNKKGDEAAALLGGRRGVD